MDPFNESDLRSFKIIEILGTSSEIKKHCMGLLISAKKMYKIIINKRLFFILKEFSKLKKSRLSLDNIFYFLKISLTSQDICLTIKFFYFKKIIIN